VRTGCRKDFARPGGSALLRSAGEPAIASVRPPRGRPFGSGPEPDHHWGNEVFAVHGSEAALVRMLAKAVGVSVGLFSRQKPPRALLPRSAIDRCRCGARSENRIS
jgi:hypothetical protein